MAGSIPAASSRIFMSYRREQTAYPADLLYKRLAKRFGRDQVFKDVDSIELGDDFVEVITRAVGSCDVLLALIGDEWLTITDAHGQRRLDNPDDLVRLEIEAALTRNIRVIPILVDGARIPRAAELPVSLASLARRQALELSQSRFDFDAGRLLKVLDRTLADLRTEQALIWKTVLDGIKKVYPEIRDLKPDVIIGLADGAVPAAVLALNCGIGILYFIDAPTGARRKEGAGATLNLEGLPSRLDNLKVLIVDNHIFTGSNMRAACEVVKARKAKEVKTCAIFCHSSPSSVHTPDYFAESIHADIIPIPWSFSQRHKEDYIATRHAQTDG